MQNAPCRGACIIHPGRPNNAGYVMRRHPTTHKATGVHRLAWEEAHGPIPDGLHVLHHCDTPACINPDHLWLGTPADNARDRQAKGRTKLPSGFGFKPGHEYVYRARTDASSRYRGVTRHPDGKWQARYSGQYLGLFDREEDAAAAAATARGERLAA